MNPDGTHRKDISLIRWLSAISRPNCCTRKGAHSRKAVLLLHGGAYLIQLSNMYRDMAIRYSKMTDNADVLMPDYRIAPKDVFPSALEDAFEAWNWLLAKGYKPKDILIVGDSAGGNLTLALTLKLRDMAKNCRVQLSVCRPGPIWLEAGNRILKK